jgi:hypothetical protein
LVIATVSVSRVGQGDAEANIDDGAESAQNFKGKTRLCLQTHERRRLAQHPCRQLRQRRVGLNEYDQLDTVAHEPSPNGHRLSTSRVERIADRPFSQL